MPKELDNHPKIHRFKRLGDLNIRILGVAPKVGEKSVALKVGEKAPSHLTPPHQERNWVILRGGRRYI